MRRAAPAEDQRTPHGSHGSVLGPGENRMREVTDRAIGGIRLVLAQGDLTQAAVDAIVNAANSSLTGGGGVDGAIHRRGGPEILEACKRLRAEQWPDGLPTGEAAITPGGRLAAKWVIHTVGPVYSRKPDVPHLLARCHESTLAIARDRLLETIAFPAISTGIYGYPLEEAAPIALGTVARVLAAEPGSVREVRFVLFDDRAAGAFEDALAKVGVG
jgi:O-acetyl-ADP-ribose deacetylase (regulator of RNase III)